MCGFAGFWQPVVARPLSSAALTDRLGQMVGRLVHRGPDDSGLWTDPAVGLALGFRRLAIRDLSPAGAQPMKSASGQLAIVFNGEIYNVDELRTALKDSGRHFTLRGHSDTEVLLEAIEAWGIETALKKSVGMFAMAVWDVRQRTLFLARDRFGEKPLYYGVHHGVLLFGSELKALREHPSMSTDVDRQSLAGLARHGYIPGPRTIYNGTHKLIPGTILAVRERDVTFGRLAEPRAYWSAAEVAENAVHHAFSGSADEAVSELERLLRRTVREQMVSDVPLGAFLSGGIDSSLVVALMQAESVRAVRTFTIGFEQAEYNEAPHAAQMSRRLLTDHTELIVTGEQARAVIPRLSEIYDEPFADSSQIPTFLVAELARRHVKVGLSGDGGDELFGGYARYPAALALWRSVGWLPRPVRAAAGAFLRSIPGLGSAPRASWRRKLHWASSILGSGSFDDAYRLLVSIWKRPDEVLARCEGGASSWSTPSHGAADRLRRMMLLDAVTYLPDDILVKVDRATMAVSLESRAPFLDHRIAEFAARLPSSLLRQRCQGKWILRSLLERFVPPELFDRPKMGFRVPLGAWLRGPLRTWADDLLDKRTLTDEGFWNPDQVRSTWTSHLANQVDASARLWPILMFQAWHAAQRSSSQVRQVA